MAATKRTFGLFTWSTGPMHTSKSNPYFVLHEYDPKTRLTFIPGRDSSLKMQKRGKWIDSFVVLTIFNSYIRWKTNISNVFQEQSFICKIIHEWFSVATAPSWGNIVFCLLHICISTLYMQCNRKTKAVWFFVLIFQASECILTKFHTLSLHGSTGENLSLKIRQIQSNLFA